MTLLSTKNKITSLVYVLLSLFVFLGIHTSKTFAQQESVVLTSGTSWTIPADADPSSITVECWGGGGGGAYTTSSSSAGGGGGGGAYAKKVFTSFVTGQTINYVIGNGGSGASGTNDGGDTWFFNNSTLGIKAAGGRGAADNAFEGGLGGEATASFGDVRYDGGKGGNGSYSSGSFCGHERASGGGGAAASPFTTGIAGGNASTSTGGFICAGNHSTGGTGGSNELFSGYTSKGGNGVTYSGAGNAGTNGAGGSGGVSGTYNGGNGGNGLIRITYNKLYHATYLSMNIGSTTWCPGETRDVTVTIKNTGTQAWIDGGGNDFNIGVKWNADADYFVRVDAENLAPGATRTYTLSVTAPNTSGNENLTFNVVQEGVSWFGGEYTSVGVDIKDVPDVDAGPDKEICAGESVVLEGTGANPIPGFSYSENFEGCSNSANCNGWTISGGYGPYIDNYYSGLSCSNSAANSNIYSGNPDSYVTSNSAIFTSNGQPAVFSFNYKTRNYNNNTSIPVAYCTFNVQWSTNGSTWNTISTFSNVSNLNCNPHTSTFTPPAGQPVYLRVHAHRNDGDFLYSIDDISVTQADFNPVLTWSGGPIVSGANTLTPTVNPTTTTTYTLTATAPGVCPATDNVIVTVPVSSTPPTASTGGGNYCHGNNITLTQSGGTDGTGAVNVWYAASGQTSPDPNSCNNEGFIELWNDFKYNDPNCYYNHHSTDYNVNDGILEVDVTGPDPFIWMYPLPGNVTIDADEYKYINVRYRVTNYVNNGVSHQPRMGVLFTKREHCDPYGYPTGYYPFSDSQYEPGSERKEINADGQWHIVSIPINNSANWHGTITGLRLDYFDPYPHEGNIGSSMEIDFLIVSKHPMIGEGKSITLSPGDEYYPTETTTYYAKKIDNCGATLCVDETVVLPPIGTTLSNNNESATCVVNANEFIHFYHTSGRFLGSINANGGNLGNVTMTTFVGAPAYMEDCNQPGHSSFHTAYMGRRWIMNSDIYTNGSDFGNNVSVRLPYNNSELVALNNFAQTDTPNNPFDGGTIDPQATRQNMMLTKITGATEDGNATQADCASTIRGIPNGGNGINPQGIANTQYIDFSIQQFSEFFLHKHQDNSPLPVELTNLSASCNKEVQINWTTASEKNSERFVVEKSRDGQTWTFVSEEQAAGNSTTTVSYTVIDTQPSGGISYYRLRQIDFDGEEEVFGPISVSCDGISNSMVVYPNPNDGTFVVEITSSEEYKNSILEITDITGRLITTQNVDIVQGTNSVLMDNSSLVVGTYIVNIRGIDGSLKPVKVIVR